MRQKRILSLVLSLIMLVLVFPTNIMAAEIDPRTQRRVYLHAQEMNPAIPENPSDIVNTSKVYTNQVADLYLAVDIPNKCASDTHPKTEDDDESHEGSQYDLNGYTVKVYYDSYYLELVAESGKEPKDNERPFDYEVPNLYSDSNLDSGIEGDEDISSGTVGDVPQKVGFFDWRHGTIDKDIRLAEKNGEKYEIEDNIPAHLLAAGIDKYAYITVFFNGGYISNGEENKWKNLCKLPLMPKTDGVTHVYIDVDTNDEYTLELFAKGGSDKDELNFDCDVVNGGMHTLNIVDSSRPMPPIADPPAGRYYENHRVVTEGVTLDADDNCEIWYTLDSSNPLDTTNQNRHQFIEGQSEPIKITVSTEIRCAAKRISDGKVSDIRSYKYDIIPDRPYLFDSAEKNEISTYYNESNYPYNVYVSDKKVFGDIKIDEGNYVYYTFSDKADSAEPEIGDNPEEEWVLVNQGAENQWIAIDQKRTVRLITGKAHEDDEMIFSEEARYYLGMKPAKVYPTPHDSGTYNEPIKVALETETVGATIKYTLDGSDPITNGMTYPYEGYEIPITDDTTIRAVATIDGIYGDKASYWYIINYDDEWGVDAFYPPGEYIGSVNVTLTPENPENVIWYRVQGEEEWKLFDPNDPDLVNGCLTFEEDVVIEAKAVKVDDKGNIIEEAEDGRYSTFDYIVKPTPPEFRPESTQFTNQETIRIYTPDSTPDNYDKYELWYTLDGSDPADPDNENRHKADDESDIAEETIYDYTVISAVVIRKNDDGTESISDVVTHSYDKVRGKPIQPIATLDPDAARYIREIGDVVGYHTQFAPVPTGTQIYYTISHNPTSDIPIPNPNDAGDGTTYLYDGNPIELRGNTVIKAVAKNVYGVSDISIFNYYIEPEAPVLPPSESDIYSPDGKLPLIPVYAVALENEYDEEGNELDDRNIVKYEVSDGTTTFTNEFVNEYDPEMQPDGDETDAERWRQNENYKYIKFWIDLSTGLAYRTDDPTGEPLGKTSGAEFDGTATVKVWNELDGIDGDESQGAYILGDDSDSLVPPFADKLEGEYEELNYDGKNNWLLVELDSLNPEGSGKIQYMRVGRSRAAKLVDTDWQDYDGTPVPIKGDVTLTLRFYKDEDNYSVERKYIYYFYPLPPTLSPISGTYSDTQTVYISYDYDEPKSAPTDMRDLINYARFYRANGDPTDTLGDRRTVEKTMTFKAYVKNINTDRNSKPVYNYYIIEDDEASGDIKIRAPFDKKRISASNLGKDDYADGIILYSDTHPNAEIHYKYTYTRTDGTVAEIWDDTIFDSNRPIMPTEIMEDITIYASLYDSEGKKIEDADTTFYIDFIHIGVPTTTLENDPKDEYTKKVDYYVVNDDHIGDPTFIVYYTTDGKDPMGKDGRPVDSASHFSKDEKHETPETLSKTTTVKTRYWSACGDTDNCTACEDGHYNKCPDGVWGELGIYKYPFSTTKTSGGGGGGGRVSGVQTTIDNTRKYTIDIFGNEHPTHIGYIKGYPDGSVQPDGNITREEVAAILYRIKNHEYEKPFTTTGEVFPDVELGRWSVKEIEYMADHDVIKGYPDGEFKPARNLTRAEFAALIFRFTELEKIDQENPFADVADDHWAHDEIVSLCATKLVQGYEDGDFRPENSITRAEVMTVINKLLGRNPSEEYVKSLGFNPFNDLSMNKWYYVIVLEATITHNYYLDEKNVEYKWEDWK